MEEINKEKEVKEKTWRNRSNELIRYLADKFFEEEMDGDNISPDTINKFSGFFHACESEMARPLEEEITRLYGELCTRYAEEVLLFKKRAPNKIREESTEEEAWKNRFDELTTYLTDTLLKKKIDEWSYVLSDTITEFFDLFEECEDFPKKIQRPTEEEIARLYGDFCVRYAKRILFLEKKKLL